MLVKPVLNYAIAAIAVINNLVISLRIVLTVNSMRNHKLIEINIIFDIVRLDFNVLLFKF